MDEDALEAVKRLRDAVKDALKGVRMLDHPAAQAVADVRAQAEQWKVLGALALRAQERFDQKKDDQAGLTYADLERRTLVALQDEDTARSVRERFDYVFVDEYQDTSDVQEAIVSRVCRADNPLHGGRRPSSRSTASAWPSPALFIDKYARYRNGDGGALIPLTRNFRSKPAILNFVNRVFERVMTGGDAEIEYDALARLNPGQGDGDPGAPGGDPPAGPGSRSRTRRWTRPSPRCAPPSGRACSSPAASAPCARRIPRFAGGTSPC